jgi:hypothetical protein
MLRKQAAGGLAEVPACSSGSIPPSAAAAASAQNRLDRWLKELEERQQHNLVQTLKDCFLYSSLTLGTK